MIRRQVNRSDWEKDPGYFGWNAFVNLIATEAYDDLSDVQRIAHLIFWYDSEVCNGGHLQYFLNPAGLKALETLDALIRVKLDCQRAVLAEAIDFASNNPISEIDTPEEYVAEALENRLGDFDKRYSACPRDITAFLKEYLEKNFGEFIEIV